MPVTTQKAPTSREDARRKRQTDKQIRVLRARRASIRTNLPWGVPWCPGPAGSHHQPPSCEGCATREWIDELTTEVDAQIQALTTPPVPAPEPLDGELFSLIGDQWVLA